MSQGTGLEHTVACTTKISSIIDDELAYAGYDIEELMKHQVPYEEVIYLLWNCRLPDQSAYQDFTQRLRKHRRISDGVEACLRIQCRQHLHPMSVLRSTVSLLGVFDPDAERDDPEATYRQSIQLQAKIGTIVAAFSRLRKGLDPVKPREDLDFAANFLYMLRGEEPGEMETAALNQALILHADHELNASTFAARVCASTLSDVYSCITAAIGTLKGPLHGGANERVFDMLEEIDASGGDVADYLREKLAAKEKIMGFGHRVYRSGDPRQRYLKEMAYALTKGTDGEKWYTISVAAEEFIRQEKGLIPNVDFYSATVYHMLGIDSDLFTLIFAMSRVCGWLAHVNEQKSENKLIRPRSEYTGERHLKYILIEER